MSSLLIDGGTILTVNDHDEVLAPGYLFIQDDRILALGQGSSPAALRQRAEQLIDASDMAVMPGMVNAHVHTFQSFLRGLSYDQPLLTWLERTVWPAAMSMTAHDVYLAAKVTLVENLRGGATAAIDHQYLHYDRGNDDAVCRAAEELGIRYLLARGWIDQSKTPSRGETVDSIMAEMERLHGTWHGGADGRIRVEFGPAAPWACSDRTMRRTIEVANRWGIGIHMHTAETPETQETHRRVTGKSHVEWLADLGGLGPRTQLAHCIWLSDTDIELLAHSGAVVVHCPVSNMYMGYGICPVRRLLERGIPVALATDGQTCNNGQEMIDILKVAADLQKMASLDTPVLSANQIFQMACRHGAAALGQPELVGSLEPNKKADVVLVKPARTGLAASTSSIPALIYAGSRSDVDTVIVDGKILMQRGCVTVIDEAALIAEAEEAWNALRLRTGVGI